MGHHGCKCGLPSAGIAGNRLFPTYITNYNTSHLRSFYIGASILLNGWSEGVGIIWLDGVQCTGFENSLLSCAASSSEVNSCTHSQDAGVRCPSLRQECTDGSVRLRGRATILEGRVELCLNNTWGTICNSQWSNYDARVVCRQLGFSSAGKI